MNLNNPFVLGHYTTTDIIAWSSFPAQDKTTKKLHMKCLLPDIQQKLNLMC